MADRRRRKDTDAAGTGQVSAVAPRWLAKIGEVSELLNITRRAIRHYEAQGLVTAIRGHGPGQIRLFDERARQRLEWISMLRAAGVGLRDIRDVLALGGEAQGSRLQLQRALEKVEAQTERLRAEMARIEPIAQSLRSELNDRARA